MFDYYYNKSLRRLVVGFGTLFNSIYVEHPNPDNIATPIKIKVPITYAPQEKFIRRLLEPSSIAEGTRIETQLPKLSYIMNSIKADPSRRRNKLTPLTSSSFTNGECGSEASQILEEVPVNVSFSLFIYTRHIDDTLQIAEQIIPYFNPDHIIQLDLNNVRQSTKIPIIMLDNNITEKFDGDFMNRRINISSFSFLAKTYIYGPIRSVTTVIDTGEIEVDSE